MAAYAAIFFMDSPSLVPNIMPEIIHRHSIKAVLVTPDMETLLMRIRLDDGTLIWVTPGGGLEDDESPEECLRRELQEELGLASFELGPMLWRRQHTYDFFGRRYRKIEHYYAVHASRFEPQMSDDVEAKLLDRFRWWPICELHDAAEPLTPLSLTAILQRYVEGGAPAEVGLEVIVD